jgi:hypothetical protein
MKVGQFVVDLYALLDQRDFQPVCGMEHVYAGWIGSWRVYCFSDEADMLHGPYRNPKAASIAVQKYAAYLNG